MLSDLKMDKSLSELVASNTLHSVVILMILIRFARGRQEDLLMLSRSIIEKNCQWKIGNLLRLSSKSTRLSDLLTNN